jgi:hypothetical protein
MLQDFLPGFPDGAIKINSRVCLLKKERIFTYFVGVDSYFSHKEHEVSAFRMAIATLIHNGHAKPVEIQNSPLGLPHRTLMRWSRQLAQRGSDSFFTPRRTRGGGVLTPEKIAECERFFSDDLTVAEVGRLADINESTLRKAVADGRVARRPLTPRKDPEANTKSERSRKDAEAAEGMGTACTRADERMAAAMGMAGHACTRFEPCDDVAFGGLLTGLPALCANGLLSGLDRHLSLPAGYYSALHILVFRPFFVVSKALSEGLGAALLEDIVPQLLEQVPGQPGEAELAADPHLHRFVIIFDREGSNHKLLSALWKKRIGAITYRKRVEEDWPETEFAEVEVTHPGGQVTRMRLASRLGDLKAGKQSMPVFEVRRMSESGHQTAIITTAISLKIPEIAARMFSRWCQENFFGYMMEHYDLDGLVQYGSEEIPGTKQVINPKWRLLDKEVRDLRARLRREQARFGTHVIKTETLDAETQGDRLQEIQQLEEKIARVKAQRREVKRKVRIEDLPEEERPTQLRPLGKLFTDTIKMIAYRAETAMVGLLRPYLAKEEEARALIRELFVSSADLRPSAEDQTLYVRVHRMASPGHDRAIDALLEKLNQENFCHPETGMKILYKLS